MDEIQSISPRVELRGVILKGIDLSEAVLIGADLRDADLSGANLRETNLSHAILCGANLERAYMERADLRGANLRGANLRNVALARACLIGADLTNADLSGASGLFAITSMGRHDAIAAGGHISIGCERYTYDQWIEKGEEIGLYHEYTAREIERYMAWIKLVVPWLKAEEQAWYDPRLASDPKEDDNSF